VEAQEKYSRLVHIGCSLLGKRWRRGIFAMFTAYFDDSGHPAKGPELVVGGFLSTVSRWRTFEDEWTEVLNEFGVTAFHMKEFTASSGEFSEWKGNEGRRIAFLKRLIKTVKKRAMASVSSAMLMDEYREVDSIYKLSEFVAPYAVCGVNTLHKTQVWLKEHGYPTDQLECIYEDGTGHKGAFVDLADRMGFPSPKFEPKNKIRALEAADFISWELGKIIRDVSNDTFRIRATIDALRKNMPRMWGIYRKADLLRFCKAQGLAQRTRKDVTLAK
jgi:hypothetical protein